MSKAQCDACTDLRATSPEFVAYGVTDKIAESLMNNTGLNPELPVLHEDCEDMADVLDCLIGRLNTDDLATCDVPDFLSRFKGNLYETLKAMNAVDCGLWEKVKLLEEILDLIKQIKDKLDECCDGEETPSGCIDIAIPQEYGDACPPAFWNSYEGGEPFLDGGEATRTVAEDVLIYLHGTGRSVLYSKHGTEAVELLGHSYGNLTVTFPTATTMHIVNTSTEFGLAVLYLTFPE